MQNDRMKKPDVFVGSGRVIVRNEERVWRRVLSDKILRLIFCIRKIFYGGAFDEFDIHNFGDGVALVPFDAF